MWQHVVAPPSTQRTASWCVQPVGARIQIHIPHIVNCVVECMQQKKYAICISMYRCIVQSMRIWIEPRATHTYTHELFGLTHL